MSAEGRPRPCNLVNRLHEKLQIKVMSLDGDTLLNVPVTFAPAKDIFTSLSRMIQDVTVLLSEVNGGSVLTNGETYDSKELSV